MSDNRKPDVDQIIEEHDKMLDEEHIESELNDLTNYFKSVNDVKKQTCKAHRMHLREAKELADMHWDCYDAFIKTGCDTLSIVNYELNEDIRTSIFLSMHGLYRPANSLLRRWLDTTIYALYFDSEFKGNNPDDFREKYNNWLGGTPVFKLKDILNKAIKDTPLNDIYLFSWDEIPGNDSDRLIDFLKQNYGIDWVKIENIEKIDNGKTIKLSNGQDSILLKLNTENLFSWDEIPGNDNRRLIEFLKKNFGIDWVKTTKIEKTDDGKTIQVSTGKNFSLKLNDKKTKLIIKIENGRTKEFMEKTENGKLNIYNTEKPEVTLKLDDGRTFKFIAKTVNGKLKIINFSDIVYIIFSDLSKYVHYGGIIRPEDLKIDFVEYNKEHFENWFKKLNQINEICYILILSKFPDMVSTDKRKYFYFIERMKKLKELLGVG